MVRPRGSDRSRRKEAEGSRPRDNRRVTNPPGRRPTEDPSNVEESVAAIDRVLEEMEEALRDLGASARSASQVDPTLRRLGRDLHRLRGMRSEERRVGKEVGSTWSSRWSADH